MHFILNYITPFLFITFSFCPDLAQANKLDTSENQGHYYLKMTKQHLNVNFNDSALQYARLGFEWHKLKSQNLDSQAIAGLQLAIVLNRLGKNEEGLGLILNVIGKAERSGNDTLLASSCGHAAIIYNHLYMDKDARKMFEKSYELYMKYDTAKAYQQLSNLVQLKARNPSTVNESLSDQRKVFAYQIKGDDPNDLARTLINFGVIFTKLEMLDSAVYYLKKVIPMESVIKKTTVENASYYLSVAYLDLGDATKALNYAQRSYDLSKELGILGKVAYSSQQLSRVYKQLNDYKQALHYYAYADSLLGQSFHENYSRRISELKVKYEAEQKQREIDRLNYEGELAQQEKVIYVILVAILIGMFVCLTGFFKRRNRLQKQEIKGHKMKKAEVEKELEFKKNEFASHSLDLIQKDGLLKDIKDSIQVVRQNTSTDQGTSEELRLLINKLDFNVNIEKNWEDFKLHFEQIHGDFSMTLSRKYPQLSSNELRLCSLIKIGLSVKEMATLLNISTQGVKTARYRLRKKFALKNEDKLLSFLHSIEAGMLEIS